MCLMFLLFLSLFLPGFPSEAQVPPWEAALSEVPSEETTLAQVPTGEATFRLGLRAFQALQNEEALRLLQRAIQEDPSLANAHYFLGLTYQNLGDDEKALPAFQRALDLNPRLLEARSSFGASVYFLKRYREADRKSVV